MTHISLRSIKRNGAKFILFISPDNYPDSLTKWFYLPMSTVALILPISKN